MEYTEQDHLKDKSPKVKAIYKKMNLRNEYSLDIKVRLTIILFPICE